ncbi:MAG: hypothetical protein H7338_15290 [Candidatus Sericytochromatia bacterium]|nr:hypothetical protein [Candidatus Sericytochromatia bacterium]
MIRTHMLGQGLLLTTALTFLAVGTHAATINPGAGRWQVLIQGQPGVPFKGHVQTASGTLEVRGAVPAVYHVTSLHPEKVFVQIERQSAGGSVQVSIVRNGRTVASRETTGISRKVWLSSR